MPSRDSTSEISASPESIGPSPEDRFWERFESLDEAIRELPGCQKIEDEAVEDEDADFDALLKRLERLVSLKQEKDRKGGSKEWIRVSAIEHEVSTEKAERVIAQIRERISDPEKELGTGATGSVFTFRHSAEDLDRLFCVKIVRDQQQYELGVPVDKEMLFLEKLFPLQVEGVRAPKPFFAFSKGGFIGLAMEHLDAVNIDRVMKGEITEGVPERLPELFDVDAYFDKLRAFIEAMHKYGVIHEDMYLRNMMVDRNTGLPRIVDFGRSHFALELEGTARPPELAARSEMDSLDDAERRLRNWLSRQP